ELLEPQADELAQLELPLVLALHHPVRVRLAVLLPADLEGVQVVALPAHADLDDVAQPGQRAVLDLHPSPHRGPDVPQGDLQLVDLAGSFRHRHLPPLTPAAGCPACPSRTGRTGSPRRAGSPRPPRAGSPGSPGPSPPTGPRAGRRTPEAPSAPWG